jgi:hypothetical protein
MIELCHLGDRWPWDISRIQDGQKQFLHLSRVAFIFLSFPWTQAARATRLCSGAKSP